MKFFRKILPLFMALVVLGMGAVTAFATTVDYNGLNFEYSREDLVNEVTRRINSGETNFVVERTFATSESDLCNDISIEINVTNNLARSSSNTVNWSLTGRYYFASNDETVSNYGNRGSADYSGTAVSYEQWDAYHTVTYKYRDTYEARCSKGTSNVTDEDHGDGIKFNATYKLQNSNTGNWADNTAIYIIVFEDGHWKSYGNYSSINVN